MDIGVLEGRLVAAGHGLAGGIWAAMESYAVPELKKIAVQIVAIGENIDAYTPQGAKALLGLQVQASVGVIVAMTSLVLLAVQDAINAILAAVRDFVNGALKFALL